MKKKLVLTTLILCSMTLAACSKKEGTKTDATTDQITSKSKEEAESARFKGKIVESPMIDEETVRLTFDKVEAIEDPEHVIETLNANGVILLANIESFNEDLEVEDLEIGNELEFTLVSPPAMTFSIPPQISGNSVLEIKGVN